MFRKARGPLALALFAGAFVGVAVGQPPGPQDRVFYTPKKGAPVKSEDAELKVDAAGVKLLVAGKQVAVVTVADIVRTFPLDQKDMTPEQVNESVRLETIRDWDKARSNYEGLREKYKTTASPRLKQWLAFRIAVTTARAADETSVDNNWKDKAEAGLKLLTEYMADNPGGWEAWYATRNAARLNHELGKSDVAAKLWAKLVKAPDVTPDLKVEAGYQEADAWMRAGRYSEAEARAEASAKDAAAGTPKERLRLIAMAAKAATATDPSAGVPALEAEIGKTKDAAVRATGQAMVGELYLAAKKPREAMWAILWVDVVYNQDRDEVAKALARLTEVYKQLGDEDRERNNHDRMRRNRGLML
jgi:hypothetical protein